MIRIRINPAEGSFCRCSRCLHGLDDGYSHCQSPSYGHVYRRRCQVASVTDQDVTSIVLRALQDHGEDLAFIPMYVTLYLHPKTEFDAQLGPCFCCLDTWSAGEMAMPAAL